MQPQWVPDGKVGNVNAYAVEKILDHKIKKNKAGRKMKYYLVKWEGDWPEDWRPASQIDNDLIAEYEKELQLTVHSLVARHADVPNHASGCTQFRQLFQQYQTQVRTERQLFMDMEADEKKRLGLPRTSYQLSMSTPASVDGQLDPDLKDYNPFKSLFDPATQSRIPDPKGFKNMMKHPYASYFIEASMKEKMENLGWKSYIEVPRESMPANTKLLKPVTVYKTKYTATGEIEKFKCRVCLDGSRTHVDPRETYEHICGFGVFRLLLCLAARFRMDVVQTDVKDFFLQARLPEDMEYYTEIPEGWAENDPSKFVAKVLAPWYGLKESAKLSGDQLAQAYIDAGMTENKYFPKVFFMWEGEDVHIVGNHIDDGIWVTSNVEKLNVLLGKIETKFKLERNYKPSKILGCEFEYDKERGIMKIHQGSYNNSKTQESKFKNYQRVRSPGHIPFKILNPEHEQQKQLPKQATEEEIRQYQKVVGQHMWGLQTDATTAYTVHRMASDMLNPQSDSWAQAERLKNYKATYPEMGPVWRAADPPQRIRRDTNLDCLTFFADSDLGGNKDGKSTTGYCAFLGESGMFDFKVKKQTCVSQSSCEAECCTAKDCTCKAIWIRNGLADMGFKFTKPTAVCQDNRSAIAMCESNRHHSRARHFRLHISFLRDCYNKRITYYPWVPTECMRGDLFNKLHGPADHERLCELNGMSHLPIHMLDAKPAPLRVDHYFDEWQQQQNAKKKALPRARNIS